MPRALFAILLASCAAPRPAPRPAPLTDTPLLAWLVEDDARRASLSGEGTITVARKGVPLRGRLTLAVKKGGFVRIDVEAPDGSVIYAFAADDRRYEILDLTRRRFSERRLTPHALADLGLAGLTTEALSALLLAHLPCRASGQAVDATHLSISECFGATLDASYAPRPHTKTAFFLTALTLRDEQGVRFSSTLRAHATSGVPRRIEIATPEATVTVNLSEVDVDVPLDAGLFQLNAPPGVLRE